MTVPDGFLCFSPNQLPVEHDEYEASAEKIPICNHVNDSEIAAVSSSASVEIDPKTITLLDPPAYRCPGRGKWTNQLKYLLTTVIKPILNLKCSRYFKAPVDPIALRVPVSYLRVLSFEKVADFDVVAELF